MNSDLIKAVIFDMGGVFIQTKDKNPRLKLAEKYGMSYEDLSKLVFQSETAQLATLGEVNEKVHWQFVVNQLNLTSTELKEFQDAFWGGDVLDQDLIEFSLELKEKYPIGLLSNAWSGARDLLTRKFDFLHVFDVSVFSAEVGLAKPDPKFYHWILNKFSLQPHEAIFVDDFIENIDAANLLGFRTVHFKSTDQAIRNIKEMLNIN